LFKVYQIALTAVAAVYIVFAINEGTPYFIALPTALLFMSVLGSDYPNRVPPCAGLPEQDRP
jgi:hypothetical protein